MKGYRTVSHTSQIENIVQKSRFIGHCYPVETEAEALAILERIRKEYWDATHNCYAYSIGANNEIARFSDDGEPSGTAGLPMMDVLRKNGMTNLLCIVTRYFGGILLGAGGLVRAYTHATADAVRAAGCIEMRPCVRFSLTVPYTLWGKVESICRENATMDDPLFEEVVRLCVSVPESHADSFYKTMIDRTDGRIIPDRGEIVLAAFAVISDEKE